MAYYFFNFPKATAGRFEPSESIGEIRLFPTHSRRRKRNHPKVVLVFLGGPGRNRVGPRISNLFNEFVFMSSLANVEIFSFPTHLEPKKLKQ